MEALEEGVAELEFDVSTDVEDLDARIGADDPHRERDRDHDERVIFDGVERAFAKAVDRELQKIGDALIEEVRREEKERPDEKRPAMRAQETEESRSAHKDVRRLRRNGIAQAMRTKVVMSCEPNSLELATSHPQPLSGTIGG